MSAGGRGGIDPGLQAILDTIRQTVAGDRPADAGPPPAVPDDPAAAAPAAPPAQSRPLRANLPPSDKSVEEFLADLIRPQVEAWLAAHLPEVVQKLAAEEIRRLTGGA